VGKKNKSKVRYLSDVAIKELALGLVRNKYFCSDQLRNAADVHMVFMPLVFLDKRTRKKIINDGVVHFYEEYSKASPRTINGYPCFMSMRMLTKLDYDDLRQVEQKLAKVLKEAL